MHADGAARMPAAEGARFVALGRGVPVHGPRGCCSPVRRALGCAGPAHLQGEHKCSSERGGRDLRLHPDDGEGVCRGDEEHHGHVPLQGVEGHERQEALGCCPSCVLGHGRPAPHAPPFMKPRPIHENTGFWHLRRELFQRGGFKKHVIARCLGNPTVLLPLCVWSSCPIAVGVVTMQSSPPCASCQKQCSKMHRCSIAKVPRNQGAAMSL